jgi:tetratricopeptide (TPR) repeat protein
MFSLSRNKQIALFWSLLGAFIVFVGLVKLYNPDIWFHVQLGRGILENLGAPDFSKFYFTPVVKNVPDLRFTWLADIILFLAHWAGGDFGLQVLQLLVIIVPCILLMSISKYRTNGWMLLLLLVVVIGTYQKQMARNAMIALPFVALVFWIWHQAKNEGKRKWLWAFPVLIGTWGCMHGSYLLGFGLMVLIFIGDILDTLRIDKTFDRRSALVYFAISLIAFTAISIKNPTTGAYYNPEKFFKIFSVSKADVAENNPTSVKQVAGKAFIGLDLKTSKIIRGTTKETHHDIFVAIKEKLNNTFFNTSGQVMLSSEFESPFDNLGYLYVKICLCACILSFILLLFIRPFRFAYFFSIASVAFLGLGYLRFIAYMPLVGAAVLVIAAKNRELKLVWNEKWASILAVIVVALMGADVASGFKVPIGTPLAMFGFGRVPIYSSACADKTFEEYQNSHTFTTITDGAFLLNRWYPKKRVFMDAFFAPHPQRIFDAYSDLHFSDRVNPDFLYKDYGIRTALLEQNDRLINKTFMMSANWYPKYIDQGMILYVYRPDFRQNMPLPVFLVKPFKIDRYPAIFEDTMAHHANLIIVGLLEKGRLKDAIAYMKKNRTILRAMDAYMDPQSVAQIKTLVGKFSADYGPVNSPAIHYEWCYSMARKQGKEDAAVANAKKVLEHAPYRTSVALYLVQYYAKSKNVDKALKYLRNIQECKDDPLSQFDKYKGNVALGYRNLAYVEEDNPHPAECYALMRSASQLSSEMVPQKALLQWGVRILTENYKKADRRELHSLLKKLLSDFPDNGRVLNEMAWFLVADRKAGTAQVLKARAYAERAVAQMVKNKNPLLDFAYDTMAEIYYKLKEYGKMRSFERKTVLAAPESRKKNYKPRIIGAER